MSCFNVTALMIMNIISNLHNIGSVWTTVVCGLVVLAKRTKLDDTQKKLSDTIAQKNVPSQTCLKQLSNRSKIIVNVALCFGGNSGKTETQGTLPRNNFTYTCSLICSRKLLKLYTLKGRISNNGLLQSLIFYMGCVQATPVCITACESKYSFCHFHCHGKCSYMIHE